jgi:hypothetical protein
LACSVTPVSTKLFLGSLAYAERLAKDNPHQIRTVIILWEGSVNDAIRASGIFSSQCPKLIRSITSQFVYED